MTPQELLLAFFTFVAAGTAAVGYVFVIRPSRAMAGPQISADLAGDERGLPLAQAAVAGAFRLIGEAVPGRKRDGSRPALIAAGYRWPSAVSIFQGIRIGTCLMLGAAGAWVAALRGEGLSGMILPALCGIGFGYMVPDRVLSKLSTARGGRLRRALPSALDLLLLSVESGQGLDAAILDTSRGLRTTHPDLASEFTQLHLELRANASREDALRNFAERSREPELRKFAALLIDTDRFGTSLGPALRTHAKYLRTRLRQSAQERARKVAVKLVFPVFFLIFPSVILVTLGPAVILIFTQMDKLIGL